MMAAGVTAEGVTDGTVDDVCIAGTDSPLKETAEGVFVSWLHYNDIHSG